MSSSALKAWRTAFLTLRDEILASPPPPTVHHLLNHLIFSQSDILIAAAPDLPPREVSSDLMLIIELVHNICQSEAIDDATQLFAKLLVLVHGIFRFSSVQVNTASWAIMLDFFKKIVLSFLQKGKTGSQLIGNVPAIKATKQCLECLRSLFGLYQTVVLSDCEQLLNFVLQVVGYFERELMPSSYLSDVHVVSGDIWEVLTVAFAMIGEVCSRVVSSLPVDIWQSIIEVLRKVMDFLASKNVLLEDNINALFYIELLNCLHQVLTEPRGYLADHVAGFVAALRIFFGYGLLNKAYFMNQAPNHMKQISSRSQTEPSGVLNRSKNGLYRPPHLRKNVVGNLERKVDDRPISSKPEFISSDSDCSDNDAATTDNCSVQFSKARLAAILCIQDLCRADPKLFTAQWTMLLPSNDVLQPRKYESTLMSCLLFDPYLKVRIAAGSTIMTMLDGPASVSLKVAEFSGHSKCGSFTSLSSSLGHILMQLHSGTLYLIKHETNSRLLALSFKILMRLISSTPYSRMSAELLSTVISSVQSTIDGGFSFQNDRNSLLAAAVNCLTIAFSVSPSSTHVENMLLEEISRGFPGGQQRSGVLYILFRYANQLSSPSISLEVLQALKAMAHNYPNIMSLCWEQISSFAFENLSLFPDVSAGLWRGNVEQTEHTVGPIKERVMTAAVKVLDECLRAISGFKGTEDLSNDKFLDSPFTSDYVKAKAISSAPSYNLDASMEDESQKCLLASERWLEATRRHMPIIIKHSSPMVRAASVTCFAGMTSSVFLTLPMDTQDFIMSSSIDAALNDEVASVRSAACRAIGVIACFPQMYLSSSSTGVLEKFIHAAARNALDSLLSVRITSSWALANICDSLSHCMDALRCGRGSVESQKISEFISLLVESSLQLARDNDKVKANAVRALGNLSRSIQFTSQSHVCGDQVECHFQIKYNGAEVSENDVKRMSEAAPSACSGSYDWLEQMVQAFLSCVTTGNVKVQWNVCHALSNLFINRSLRLQEMDWASSVFSILLLLLRDSSNFKIRIQAAAALSVPETIHDYGKSYYDVIKSVEHVVENFKSDRISDPSNFKYWIALDKQLTSTMLHLLGLAASSDHQTTQEFFVKKASFFEAWIKDLCLSLGDTSNSHDEVKQMMSMDQKRDVIFRTIHSLIQVYENKDHHIAQRFHKLAGSLL